MEKHGFDFEACKKKAPARPKKGDNLLGREEVYFAPRRYFDFIEVAKGGRAPDGKMQKLTSAFSERMQDIEWAG